MKVLISGVKGQLGKSVFDLINSSNNNSIEVLGLDKIEFNLQDFEHCKRVINKFKPNWIINTAAYTAVDLAESNRDLAFSVNAEGVENLAKSVSNIGGKLIHISTDFVFDGNKKTPYKTKDICHPINTYGESKLLGEKLALKHPGTLILRTSWLYSHYGRNFCLTMLKLHKKNHQKNTPLKVVSDQMGSPTSCSSLAGVCWQLISTKFREEPSNKIFHWSDKGIITWYEFSKAIGILGKKLNLIDSPAEVIPIKSADFSTEAKRPNYSALDCSNTLDYLNIKQRDWKDSLEDVMKSINKKDIL